MNHYEDYYATQVGGGGISQIYVGSPYQRGHGIGSFLGGLFRRVLPFLARGARAVGKEALRAGINVMDDVEHNMPLKRSVKSRFEESGGNLKRKAMEKVQNLMNGSGYKTIGMVPRAQLIGIPRPLRVTGVNKSNRRTKTKKVKKIVKNKKKKRKSNKKSKKSSRRRETNKKTKRDIFTNI